MCVSFLFRDPTLDDDTACLSDAARAEASSLRPWWRTRANERGMTPCSRKRVVLAIYLDFLLFATVVQVASWLIVQRPFSASAPVLGVAFAVIETGMLQGLGGSPAAWALGIVQRDGKRVVLSTWRLRERWWTAMIGVLALLSGTKEATRWTLGLPPPPFMGFALSWDAAAAVITTTGLASIVAGMGVLRTSARAALLGVALNLLTLVSWTASAPQIPVWVEARARAQSAMLGTPMRAGDTQRLTFMLRGGVLFGALVGGAWLLLAWRRFRRLDAAEPTP